MKWFPSTRERRRARPVVPRVEGLEERSVPVANFAVNGSTLTVIAPTVRIGPAANRILVEDNGTNNINNVTASVNGVRFKPNVAINSVVFDCGAGAERITYNMTGSLLGGRTVDAGLGAGADSFRMTVRRDFALNATLNVAVRGGANADKINMTLIGNMPRASFLFNATGAAGNDNLLFQTTSSLTVGPLSHLGWTMRGGGGIDRVRSVYNGRLDGTINFENIGGGGADRVAALVSVFAGSIGELIPSSVLGNGGNDNLRFIVNNTSTLATTFNQLVDGDGGRDRCTRTNDVFQQHCEVDIVV